MKAHRERMLQFSNIFSLTFRLLQQTSSDETARSNHRLVKCVENKQFFN